MESKSTRNILIILLAFLSLSSIGGGGSLVISPSGKLTGSLPLSLLEHSPFTNFLIPGIILFLILGIFPAFIIYALVKKPANRIAEFFNFFKDMHWAWSFTIYVAFALIVWIQVETMFIQEVSWLQTFYMLYAIPVIFVALLPHVRAIYKKR
jgi:hypothetical protein